VERGLSEHTVLDAYGPAARLFLAAREGPDGLGLEWLCAADVSSFLARECPKRSVPGARDLVCAQQSRPSTLSSTICCHSGSGAPPPAAHL
jgi:hypothetical protein